MAKKGGLYMYECYCSFEVAKLLKESGFDWKCNRYYLERDSDNEPLLCPGSTMYGEDYNKRLQRDDLSVHINVSSGKISAPTQQMAMRWLREERGIHIYPIPVTGFNYIVAIYAEQGNEAPNRIVLGNRYNAYEDAVEAALEYALKNLI